MEYSHQCDVPHPCLSGIEAALDSPRYQDAAVYCRCGIHRCWYVGTPCPRRRCCGAACVCHPALSDRTLPVLAGSILFHATLRYWYQLTDEIPLYALVATAAYITYFRHGTLSLNAGPLTV